MKQEKEQEIQRLRVNTLYISEPKYSTEPQHCIRLMSECLLSHQNAIGGLFQVRERFTRHRIDTGFAIPGKGKLTPFLCFSLVPDSDYEAPDGDHHREDVVRIGEDPPAEDLGAPRHAGAAADHHHQAGGGL